jgi:hypothetical protein
MLAEVRSIEGPEETSMNTAAIDPVTLPDESTNDLPLARRTRRLVIGATSLLASVTILLLGAYSPRLDREKVVKAVREDLEKHGGPVKVGLWVGGASGDARFSIDGDKVFPTASAIKKAILIELFARFSNDLDQPPPGLLDILKDAHPAIAHFTPAQRDEVRKGLAGASVRRIGGIMMGSVPASNLVYNAAANVSIAALGGPEQATRAIRARDSAFAPIAVRRYMLADRRANGDNEATPAALAAVLQRLASRQVPGLEASTTDEIRRALLAKDDPRRGRHSFKEGDLASDPLSCVRTGWFEPPGGPVVVYVVMTAQDNPGDKTRDEAYRNLVATAARLTETLIDAGSGVTGR